VRILDLDLDFFLNKNSYRSVGNSWRLGSEYKPWSASKVRHFLEYRCLLSSSDPVKGHIVESHDEVLNLWRRLIESNDLRVPFAVVHIDAHPDLWIGDGLSLTSGSLSIASEQGLAHLKKKHIHSGNYLTHAISYGWVSSLVWVPLGERLNGLPEWDADARSILKHRAKWEIESSSTHDLTRAESSHAVSFNILPWQRFRMSDTFDYMALSKSPNFTPPESDRLISVVERYMKQT
jgi:hypothetical protein